MDSYGYVETRGLVAAIEAADTALKTADVVLANCYIVKGGIVTVEITGDVAAVTAAVDAAAEKAKMLGNYLGSNVIARPDPEIGKILVRDRSIKDSLMEEGKGKDAESTKDGRLPETRVDTLDARSTGKVKVDEDTEGAEGIRSDVNAGNTESIKDVGNTGEALNYEVLAALSHTQADEDKRAETNESKGSGEDKDEAAESKEAEGTGADTGEDPGNDGEAEEPGKVTDEKNPEDKNPEDRERSERERKLKREYQDMKVAELKKKLNSLKTEHTWNQIKGMNKKKLIEILLKNN